ncbi:WD domain, G-beta repeat protein [Necator americanus]|uniref:WD domain, G-beta repeat protein n=1 Tax=Necator americanus TaxID=51031 RepID=W2TMC7_NECAM|nr:WD domain, G-beta repeat protein [Necator americanus]ETN82918.1 WD domain, G-beta repeat protein [Necator americanus]
MLRDDDRERDIATVVLTSFDGSRQSGEGHVVGAARHPFTCLAFSPCGRYIATGEVNAIAISPDSSICVTVGSKHVKYWHLPAGDTQQGTGMQLGCTNGIVRLYDKQNLNVLCMLPHPAFIGMDPAVASTAELLEVHPQGVTYPDVRALCCTSAAPEAFISAYSDRSMFVFRRGDNPSQWSKLSSSMAHVGAVTTVKRYPSRLPYLPTGSFITGGVDGTVRIWSMERNEDQICPIPGKNLLSPTLKKIIHVEENFGALVEPRGDVNFLPNERNESTTGIRCLTVSPDGKHLVAGTKCGNIHVVDLSDPEMSQLEVISAHELDVQCLEYSNNARGAPYLLASGGRDRLVHIFRPAATSYDHCYVIDDHQSALTAVRFVQNENNDLYLFTCGSDKIIIIWRLDVLRFNRENLISAPVGINDLLISMSGPSLMASCQDRQLRSYSFAGKLLTTFCLDPSCTYAASVCSDRHVYVVEAKTGKCVAAVTGIGESATDVEFSEDCRWAACRQQLLRDSRYRYRYIFTYYYPRLLNLLTSAEDID